MFFKRLKIILISFFFLGFVENSYSIEPSDFVQLTVNKASDALNSNFTKEKKIEMLKTIAKETVDIRGIGFYTLGSHKKNITDNQKKDESVLKNVKTILLDNPGNDEILLEIFTKGVVVKMDWSLVKVALDTELIENLRTILGDNGTTRIVED